MQKLRKFFEKKKLVSNDSETPNSARNGKKKLAADGGTSAVFSSKLVKIYVKFFSFLPMF